uniref:Uncharacterized protein n=1 Tax=Rhizophora mucronata TaxID=61149 RepID=A0A2P2MXD3_RHIMU
MSSTSAFRPNQCAMSHGLIDSVQLT